MGRKAVQRLSRRDSVSAAHVDPRVEPTSESPPERIESSPPDGSNETFDSDERASAVRAVATPPTVSPAEVEALREELAAKTAEIESLRLAVQAASERARSAERERDVLRARAESASAEPSVPGASGKNVGKVVAELRGVLEALERIEIDVAEARSDARQMATRVMHAIGQPETLMDLPALVLLPSSYPEALATESQDEALADASPNEEGELRPTLSVPHDPDAEVRPTQIPAGLNVDEMMRAVEQF